MPYTIDDPPDAIKGLPKHAQEIFIAAYNAAHKLYKGDEAKANATAWAAVKAKYKKVGDKWVAKESKEAGMVTKTNIKEAEKLSTEDKRRLLQAAIVDQMGYTKDNYVYLEDYWDKKLVYRLGDQSYEMTYKMDAEGNVKLGAPQKVARTTVFNPIEALREKYNEVIEEAGRRNATLDSTRIRKILALCQELLSSEGEPDEGKAKEALKEVATIMVWLEEQALTKTEDGIKFPKAAYAYIGDPEKTTTWKLRLWEDLEKKVTRAQLGRAAAALSPGGFRGQKVQIPAAGLPAVKRKIRAEYRKLDVGPEEMPRWVKETETRERILDFVDLTEATFDKGRATVIVIKAGFNATEDRYYPAEMLRRDYGIFEGMKMYADHPTKEEDDARPERSIKDWVATLTEVKCDDKGTVTGIAEIVEPWLMSKLAALREKGMLSEMGISINALGWATKGTIEGKDTLIVEKLDACRSVDFVTEPGAGGVVTLYESDRDQDIDLIELSTLKDKRPDLVKAIEATVRAEVTKEVKKAMENEERIKELEAELETKTKELGDLKEAVEKAEEEKVKAEAQATIKEAVDKAELPDAAKERLIERFKDAETADGIEEAITSETDYISKLAEAGKVKGMGPSKTDPEADKKALTESVKKAHPDWDDEAVKTFVENR